jgi:hypothetical protein
MMSILRSVQDSIAAVLSPAPKSAKRKSDPYDIGEDEGTYAMHESALLPDRSKADQVLFRWI